MELSKHFLDELKLIDQKLDAVFDENQDSIHVSAMRTQGLKVLENTFTRKSGELYPELERRVLKELRNQDVWKIHGSGKAYDNYLADKEEEEQKRRQREVDDLDRQWTLENKRYINEAIENAKRGIFSVPKSPKEGRR